jgi:hypothetical protein
MIHKSPAVSVSLFLTELFHRSCWSKVQEVSIINQDIPSMSTHSALSMGNNLTASCEDMQDDFQSTFVPWRRGCWYRASPCTQCITATLQIHVENDLGFCPIIYLCSRLSLTLVIFISENTSHSYYNLSVPTNAHIILIYISPLLVPTGFG